MRKILLNLAVSLDGFIAGPNGEYDWCLTDQDYGMREFLERTDTILFGRKSYDLLLELDRDAWPNHARYVFSRTLQSAEKAIVIPDDIEDHIKAMRIREGKDIWLFGGAELSVELLRLGMIDELHLSVHPLLLGEGKPIFIDNKFRTHLLLTDTKTFSSGLVQLIYTVIH